MPNNNSFDESRFVALLEDAISKVKTEEDPIVLTEMKRLFKKHVPFTLRTYVAAYLAKQISQGFRGGNRGQGRYETGGRGERSPRREHLPSQRRREFDSETAAGEPRPTPRRVTIDEEHAATIFIGIGKNRRVYTRDLITLLMQVCKLERERIGRIRNQENYSFVELFKEDVDDVIATLNGYNYKGRNLMVSYARKKDGESAENVLSNNEAADQSAPQEEAPAPGQE